MKLTAIARALRMPVRELFQKIENKSPQRSCVLFVVANMTSVLAIEFGGVHTEANGHAATSFFVDASIPSKIGPATDDGNSLGNSDSTLAMTLGVPALISAIKGSS
jgi:hypothetical protein